MMLSSPNKITFIVAEAETCPPVVHLVSAIEVAFSHHVHMSKVFSHHASTALIATGNERV
jgi:hypothetical protein